jgi:acetamidase/formamidase
LIEIDGSLLSNIHFKWSAKNKPIATIRRGEMVKIKIPDSSTNQIRKDWGASDLEKLDFSKVDACVGPIYVDDARKGDTLEVELLNIEPGELGWSMITRDFGFLKHIFSPELVFWDLSDGYAVPRGNFLKGVKVPIQPFLGIVGVAPANGEFDVIPPQVFGGNMDNRLLKKGARLYLPIFVDGALLSVADPHAAQGDGEVTGTAIETDATVTLRVNVLHEKPPKSPVILSSEKETEVLACTGISDDLYEAAKLALENALDQLERRGFTRKEAYVLCSVAGDLRISEIVDEPNLSVTMILPVQLIREHQKALEAEP